MKSRHTVRRARLRYIASTALQALVYAAAATLLLPLQAPQAGEELQLLDTIGATPGSSTTPNVGGTTAALGFLFRASTASAVTDVTAIVQRATDSNLVAAYEASSVAVHGVEADGTLGNRLGTFRPSCLPNCSSSDISDFGSTAFYQFNYQGQVSLAADTRYWLLIRSTALGDFGRRFFLPLGSFSYGESPWRFATSSDWFFRDSFTDSYGTLSSAPLLVLAGPEPTAPSPEESPAASAAGAAVPVPGLQGAPLLALGVSLTLAASRRLHAGTVRQAVKDSRPRR